MTKYFLERGYARTCALLSPELRRLVRQYMDLSHRCGRMTLSNNDVVDAQFEQYGAMLSETLLCSLRPRIEAIVGDPLIPSYSFWRIYERNAALRPHVDRAACEIGVSIAIAAEPKRHRWPIWVQGIDGRTQDVALKCGDGIVYEGTRVRHWREPFEGDVHYQMFLHYVRREGPNARWAYDSRDACGLPQTHTEARRS